MKTSFKKQSVNRLHRLQGQLKGLEKMIGQDKYCMDILTQASAVEKSLQSLKAVILENHLREHSFHMIKNNREAQALKELKRLFKLSNPVA